MVPQGGAPMGMMAPQGGFPMGMAPGAASGAVSGVAGAEGAAANVASAAVAAETRETELTYGAGIIVLCILLFAAWKFWGSLKTWDPLAGLEADLFTPCPIPGGKEGYWNRGIAVQL